jgi:hypothetical protein
MRSGTDGSHSISSKLERQLHSFPVYNDFEEQDIMDFSNWKYVDTYAVLKSAPVTASKPAPASSVSWPIVRPARLISSTPSSSAALWKHRELIVNFELPCKYFHLLIDMEFPEVMSIVMLPRRIVEDSTYDCIRMWL